MRRVEHEMVRAIRKRKSWRGKNTEVRVYSDLAKVYLFGKHIADYVYGVGTVVNENTLSQWPTVTTKSRLRALNVDVYTSRHITYLNGQPV